MPNESDMVPKSAGLSEGNSGADVRRLQRYLEKFGYVDSPVLSQFGVSSELAEAPPTKVGTFDENTRRALEKFQERYGLEPTGEVDEATLELMGTRRCGFPDTAEFVLQGNKWSTTNLRYGFQEFTPDITQAQARAATSTALGYWSAVTPLTFGEVPIANNPEIRIRFVAGDHGDGSPFAGPGGVLAHAFYPPPNGGDIAGDAHFDEAETWSINLPPSGVDLYTVGAHEYGHSLGLAHSTVSDALMYPYYGGPHRYLAQDDINGIQALYGALQWHTVTLDRVYATPHSKNAWAYLHGVGWRKIQPLTTDGVTNVFAMCCRARSSNKSITVQANASEILVAYL
jgi:peptidoglycan hydrolase-like protein with peptidoglycan-binding domain